MNSTRTHHWIRLKGSWGAVNLLNTNSERWVHITSDQVSVPIVGIAKPVFATHLFGGLHKRIAIIRGRYVVCIIHTIICLVMSFKMQCNWYSDAEYDYLNLHFIGPALTISFLHSSTQYGHYVLAKLITINIVRLYLPICKCGCTITTHWASSIAPDLGSTSMQLQSQILLNVYFSTLLQNGRRQHGYTKDS